MKNNLDGSHIVILSKLEATVCRRQPSSQLFCTSIFPAAVSENDICNLNHFLLLFPPRSLVANLEHRSTKEDFVRIENAGIGFETCYTLTLTSLRYCHSRAHIRFNSHTCGCRYSTNDRPIPVFVAFKLKHATGQSRLNAKIATDSLTAHVWRTEIQKLWNFIRCTVLCRKLYMSWKMDLEVHEWILGCQKNSWKVW